MKPGRQSFVFFSKNCNCEFSIIPPLKKNQPLPPCSGVGRGSCVRKSKCDRNVNHSSRDLHCISIWDLSKQIEPHIGFWVSLLGYLQAVSPGYIFCASLLGYFLAILVYFLLFCNKIWFLCANSKICYIQNCCHI